MDDNIRGVESKLRLHWRPRAGRDRVAREQLGGPTDQGLSMASAAERGPTAPRDPTQRTAPGSASPQDRPTALKWSWRVATISGIDIHIHATFLLLIAYLAFGGLAVGQSSMTIVRGTLLVLAVFATVVLHELGHALMARRFGIGTRDITLLPIGGIARLEGMPDKPGQQLLVAVAGPGVNLAIALILFAVLSGGGQVTIDSVYPAAAPFLLQLAWINVSLAAFNLLPGYPMDGGRVVRALLAMRMPPERATQVAARVGQGMAVVFGLAGLFWSPVLMLIAIFVWLGAQSERSISEQRAALVGVMVRQGMITDFRTLAPGDPLSHAVDLTLSGFQRDFPVMDNTRLVGVLTYSDLLRGLAEPNRSVSVDQVMRAEFQTATSSDPLDRALAQMHQDESRMLAVVERDKLVGILTVENVGELIALQAAARHTGSVNV